MLNYTLNNDTSRGAVDKNTLLMPSNFRKTNKNQQVFWANDILFHLGSLTHMYLHKQIVHLGSVSRDSANEYTEDTLTREQPVGRNSHLT